MSLPANSPENDAMQLVPTGPSVDDCYSVNDIPRRLMRVKVLYTFDDQNKSNCLARLPNALSVPTVSLDETTQVGVIELKTCIQAIVAASPELVAKLGHDYTVYAYDYSEYETPLVGQGMLSWILASASATPNAPADQSQTMVTGRVCKNILGLFSNGIKETLEVKLKLVPVPTSMQREYVENMERYHSLSRQMPEGLDYSAWAEFLKANPAIGQLAHPTPEDPSRSTQQTPYGRMESIHQMPAQPMRAEEALRHDMFCEQMGMPYSAQGTRPSSPAMSAASYNPYMSNYDSRPVSRASFRSETAAQAPRHPPTPGEAQDQQEEGPPKKRARVTKAKRPRKTALGANSESLRVTASTAASVRLHRPIATNLSSTVASIEQEQVPRAPTPRPGNRALPQPRHVARIPAPSSLRHASMDEGRRFSTPYESGVFSDTGVDSADDERGGSPDETPMEMPSSPPVMHQRIASSVPSSPGLPTLPYPADSGFVSDMGHGRDEDETGFGNRPWDGSDLPTAADVRTHPAPGMFTHPWTEVNPGPVELLPKSYVPKPKTYPRSRSILPIPENTEKPAEDAQHMLWKESSATSHHVTDEQLARPFKSHTELSKMVMDDANPAATIQGEQIPARSTASPPMEPSAQRRIQQDQPVDLPQQGSTSGDASGSAGLNVLSASGNDAAEAPSRSGTPNPAPKRSKPSKPRGLPRSQTWSGEAMSDVAVPLDGNSRQPRSGSGAKRKQNIKDKCAAKIAAGEMPQWCGNCGEIDTPTWRKAYTYVENGLLPTDVKLSSEGNGIVGFDNVDPAEGGDGGPRYRVYKLKLDQQEKDSAIFTLLTLCNPCGLWLNKKGFMRPRTVWEKKDKPAEKPKRKRNPPKGPRKRAKGQNGEIMSDAIVPHSEPVMHESRGEGPAPIDTPFDAHTGGAGSSQLDDTTAQAALRRAIQSSPAGFRGSKDSPIDIEQDLTPRPTRRLLFPSPRKTGELKLLDGSQSSVSPSSKDQAAKTAELAVRLSGAEAEDTDKENCPPRADHEDYDFAHLFEDGVSPKTTPTKGASLEDLLKTPTPGSRRRGPLTPKRGAGNAERTTPSRNIMTTTPNRSGRAATVAPETPFTRQLNSLFSDCLPSSPSQAIDLSAFPTFNTPGRTTSHFGDFMTDDFMSSDLPIPSSPPGVLGFSLYEDPATSTVGLWSGASIFEGSDPVRMEGHEAEAEEQGGHVLKINGVAVDFGAMIDQVVGNGSKSPDHGGQDVETDAGAAKRVG